MDNKEPWLKWAVELQAIAQAGLFYGKDCFDKERYERIREISAEMLSLSLIFPKSNNAGKSSFICCAEHRTTEIINDKKKNIFFINVPCDDLNQLDITDNYL